LERTEEDCPSKEGRGRKGERGGRRVETAGGQLITLSIIYFLTTSYRVEKTRKRFRHWGGGEGGKEGMGGADQLAISLFPTYVGSMAMEKRSLREEGPGPIPSLNTFIRAREKLEEKRGGKKRRGHQPPQFL